MQPNLLNVAHSNMAAACSFKEQLAVEGCFLTKGTLLPTFHKFYWMGLRTGEQAWRCLTLWLHHSTAGCSNRLLLICAGLEQIRCFAQDTIGANDASEPAVRAVPPVQRT